MTNMKLKHTKNNLFLLFNVRGFSMVGVLFSAGLMGGLAMVLAELSKQQLTLEKRSETNLELNILEQKIKRIIYNDTACLNTIQAPAQQIQGASVQPDAIINKAGGVVFETIGRNPNAVYGKGLIRIKRMRLKVINVTSPNPTSNKTAEVNLRITFQKNSRAIIGENELIKNYPLTIELDSSNNPLSCHSELQAAISTATKQICENLGGTYDDVSGKCPPPMAISCSPFSGTGHRDPNIPNHSANSFVAGFDASGRPICGTPPSLPHPTGENCFMLRDYLAAGGGDIEGPMFKILNIANPDPAYHNSLSRHIHVFPGDPNAHPNRYIDLQSIYINEPAPAPTTLPEICPTGYSSRWTCPYNGTAHPSAFQITMCGKSVELLEHHCCK